MFANHLTYQALSRANSSRSGVQAAERLAAMGNQARAAAGTAAPRMNPFIGFRSNIARLRDSGIVSLGPVTLAPACASDERGARGRLRIFSPMEFQEDLQRALSRFVGALELVFHDDWDYSRGMVAELEILDRVTGDGTFLHPGPAGRISNWGALSSFYDAYAELQRQMVRSRLTPDPPKPDDCYDYGWPDTCP